MAGKKDKNKDKGRRGPGLTRKDAELWLQMTRDVERFPERDYGAAENDVEEKAVPVPVREHVSIQRAKHPGRIRAGKDVDAATMRKFTRGQMTIEAMIDLHGLGQSEAREALRRFITSSHRQGRRCVLVITGKGQMDKPGVLKTRVPEWLDELGPVVLKTAAAQARHGGKGALYVLLRRQRD